MFQNRSRIYHFNKLQFGDTPKCTFWNQNSWSGFGCRLNEELSNRTVSFCQCNHTTNFAVIMDIAHREINDTVKSILTYICSSITVIMSTAAMILSSRYHIVPKVIDDDRYGYRRNKYFIHQNICIWLIISHFLIMFGLDRTEYKILCLISSLFLFYALLCTFTFIMMMTILLFRSTSQKQLFSTSTLRQYSVMGYFFPIMIISFALLFVYFSETKDLALAFCGEYL